MGGEIAVCVGLGREGYLVKVILYLNLKWFRINQAGDEAEGCSHEKDSQ